MAALSLRQEWLRVRAVIFCLAGAGRLEFRPMGDHQENAIRAQPLEQQAQELERRWVHPLCVLDQHQDRLPRRLRLDHAEQRLQGPLLQLLRDSSRAEDSALPP